MLQRETELVTNGEAFLELQYNSEKAWAPL